MVIISRNQRGPGGKGGECRKRLWAGIPIDPPANGESNVQPPNGAPRTSVAALLLNAYCAHRIGNNGHQTQFILHRGLNFAQEPLMLFGPFAQASSIQLDCRAREQEVSELLNTVGSKSYGWEQFVNFQLLGGAVRGAPDPKGHELLAQLKRR